MTLCTHSVTLGRYVYIKQSRFGKVEAATMRFVRQHTTIPVPRVYAVVPYRRNKYIFMERISGNVVPTAKAWKSLSEVRRERILHQLRDFISQIRAIGPPPQSPPFICSVLGGPVCDYRLCVEGPYGPYRDEEQMNLQLRLGRTPEEILQFQGLPSHFAEEIREAHALRHPIVFTHGDLALRNIMVDGDRVTGLLDWECAGWFPAHWEYVKACWCQHFCWDFAEEVHKFVPRFDQENRAAEIIGWSCDWGPALDLPQPLLDGVPVDARLVLV